MSARLLSFFCALGLFSASTLLPALHDCLHHPGVHSHAHHGHEHAHEVTEGLSLPSDCHDHVHAREADDGLTLPSDCHGHDSASCTLCQSILLATAVPPAELAEFATSRDHSAYRLQGRSSMVIIPCARGPPKRLVSPFSSPMT